MLREFDRMSGEYGFRVLDASRSVRRVASDLRRAVARVVDAEREAIKDVSVAEAKAALHVAPSQSPTTAAARHLVERQEGTAER
jgi:hypothetical protein